MKFMSIYTYPKELAGEPTDAEMMAMGALIGEMQAAGVMAEMGGHPAKSTEFRVNKTGANVTVTDGPFTEAKELIGGYCVFKVQSRDEALMWTKKFLETAGDGLCTVVELMD